MYAYALFFSASFRSPDFLFHLIANERKTMTTTTTIMKRRKNWNALRASFGCLFSSKIQNKHWFSVLFVSAVTIIILK